MNRCQYTDPHGRRYNLDFWPAVPPTVRPLPDGRLVIGYIAADETPGEFLISTQTYRGNQQIDVDADWPIVGLDNARQQLESLIRDSADATAPDSAEPEGGAT